MQDDIQSLLAELEASRRIRILHACEGGSRAWGFASADSDFDVRFVHVKPREWHVRLQEAPTTGKASVVEHKSEDRVLDGVGWDLRRALLLVAKPNPSPLEHMHSPIVYRNTPDGEELAGLARRDFSSKRRLHPTRAWRSGFARGTSAARGCA
ncbi:MAG: hypothetical protein RL112_1869 [Planctomycetota bacterium]